MVLLQSGLAGRAYASSTTQVVGLGSAVVGTVAGFWHILWIAGAASLVFAILGVVVYASGFRKLAEHPE